MQIRWGRSGTPLRPDTEPIKITFEHVSIAYAFLGFGLLISILVFSCEVCMKGNEKKVRGLGSKTIEKRVKEVIQNSKESSIEDLEGLSHLKKNIPTASTALETNVIGKKVKEEIQNCIENSNEDLNRLSLLVENIPADHFI